MEMAPKIQPPSAPQRCLEEEVFISLRRTGDSLSRRLEKLLKSADISPNQYNVLRILRGSPQGLPCAEIGDRMISRDPDITRLLDRLEKAGLVARRRDSTDRRVVLARITPQGLKVLAELDAPIITTHREQLGHLGPTRLRSLLQLLESARQKAA